MINAQLIGVINFRRGVIISTTPIEAHRVHKALACYLVMVTRVKGGHVVHGRMEVEEEEEEETNER